MTQDDKLAWEIIRKKKQYPYSEAGIGQSGRPKNFNKLETLIRNGTEFEVAFALFLDEFYTHRFPEFFSSNVRAMLAATAEFLSIEFGLLYPEWVDKSEYFLAQYGDPRAESMTELFGPGDWGIDKNCADPAFLRHGVLQKAKSLIRL